MTNNSDSSVGGHVTGIGATRRIDSWWISPAYVVAFIGVCFGYGTWAAFQGAHYWVGSVGEAFGGYLSPLYSPVLLWTAAEGAAPASHSWFGAFPSWWPDTVLSPRSPALLILVFPGLFRFTCYYYRKAYYRAFAAAPPGCSVEGVRKGKYAGETKLFLVQNLHRYAMYTALVFNCILAYDAFQSYFLNGSFGIGVGSIVLTVNATLLAFYTFGCHSLRHLIGGRLNCFTCDGTTRMGGHAWNFGTFFNERHMKIAWLSLGWVMFTDVYVRMVSMGHWHDFNTWGEAAQTAARTAGL